VKPAARPATPHADNGQRSEEPTRSRRNTKREAAEDRANGLGQGIRRPSPQTRAAAEAVVQARSYLPPPLPAPRLDISPRLISSAGAKSGDRDRAGERADASRAAATPSNSPADGDCSSGCACHPVGAHLRRAQISRWARAPGTSTGGAVAWRIRPSSTSAALAATKHPASPAATQAVGLHAASTALLVEPSRRTISGYATCTARAITSSGGSIRAPDSRAASTIVAAPSSAVSASIGMQMSSGGRARRSCIDGTRSPAKADRPGEASTWLTARRRRRPARSTVTGALQSSIRRCVAVESRTRGELRGRPRPRSAWTCVRPTRMARRTPPSAASCGGSLPSAAPRNPRSPSPVTVGSDDPGGVPREQARPGKRRLGSSASTARSADHRGNRLCHFRAAGEALAKAAGRTPGPPR
jgi:hypothetical protein